MRELCFANERHPEDRRVRKRLGFGTACTSKPGKTGQRANRCLPCGNLRGGPPFLSQIEVFGWGTNRNKSLNELYGYVRFCGERGPLRPDLTVYQVLMWSTYRGIWQNAPRPFLRSEVVKINILRPDCFAFYIFMWSTHRPKLRRRGPSDFIVF